ncbi:ribonuclease HII [Clostridium sp. CAG:921]|nr:ribonuclease HII [Clostridium sp. CAG:921]
MYRIVGETVKEEELERLKNMLLIEESLYDEGYEYICGVDEAGRGPLCGPVVAAAVILPKHGCIEGVNDSKKISEKKREKLYDDIMKGAIAVGIGISDVDVIEKVNILNATKIAMKKAIESLSIKPDYVLIDGNQKIDIDILQETVVSGDAKSESIASASIIAKVTRDRMLRKFDEMYPEYGFAKHKGYGTKAHIEAIKKYGLTPIHRKSFCTKFI